MSENTAPCDSKPPHQSTTEGSSWPGGLTQAAHPQPCSQKTLHAARAHVGIPTDLPTLCSSTQQVCCVHLSRVMPRARRPLFLTSSMQTGCLAHRARPCPQAMVGAICCHPHRNNPHPEQSPSTGISGKAGELGAGEVYSPFNLDTLTPFPPPLPRSPL